MKPLSNIVSALPVSAALTIDLRAKALISEGKRVISFCVGEPDFPTPAPICDAGVAAILGGNTKYTNASGTNALREAVALSLYRDTGVSYAPSEIVITTGAKYAVYAAALAILNPGDEVILPAPYWTSYAHIVRLAGGVPVLVPCGAENGWKMTPDAFAAAVTPKTKALILNNPNNPTGAVYSRYALCALAEVCREADLYVIADEIYSRLLYTGEPFCAAAAVNADMRARTVTVNGVSKAYAMTGWRIGYAAGDEAIIRNLSALLSHTTGSPNTMAQAAAAEALVAPQWETERMRQTYRARRDCLLKALESVPGVHCTKPEGAFYALLDVREKIGKAYPDDVAFALALLEKEGVATVPCADYGAHGYLRLSYTLEEKEIIEGVRRIRRFIEDGGDE